MPSVDVYECRGKLMIVVEVPGLSPGVACASPSATGTSSSPASARERAPRGRPASCAWSGRRAASRAWSRLDVPVDVRSAEAHLEGGLLTVTIPRLKDRRGRETVIPVQREDTMRPGRP